MELEPEYFNSAIMKKLDVLVQDGVGPVLARMLRDTVGNDWGFKFNDYLERRKAPKIRWSENRPLWDFNGIMHGILFYGEKSKSKSAEDERTLAEKLRKLRNDISHASIDDIETRASIERTFDFMRTAQLLLDAFGASAQNREVIALISSYESYLKRSSQEGGRSNPGQLSGNEERWHSKSDGKETDNGQTNRKTEAGTEGGVGTNAESPTSRATQLPKSAPGIVWFPTIGDGLNDDFGYFRATKLEHPHKDALTHLFGLPDGKKPEALEIINQIRADEADDILASWTTRIRSDGSFVGPSFGVALALADRSARYGIASELAGVTVIATGAILPQKRGAVGEILGLAEKLALIETSQESRSAEKILFVFPQANLDIADRQVRATLARWNSEGSSIQWKAISHIDELNDLLGGEELAPGSDAEETFTTAAIQSDKLTAETNYASLGRLEGDSNAIQSPSRWQKIPKSSLVRGSAVGFLAMIAVTGITLWLEQSRVDPAVLQASDNRLSNLVRAAELARMSDTDPDLCNKVGRAFEQLDNFDRSRLTQDAKSALSFWQSCHDQFTASDGRLSTLVKLAVNAKSGRQDVEALARATKQISAFDLSRSLTSAQRDALVLGKEAAAVVEASRARLADLGAAWKLFQEDRNKFEDQLKTALAKITPEDEKLADSDELSQLKSARKFFSDKQLAASMMSVMKQAADQYQAKPSYSTAKSLVSAYEQLENGDQSLLLKTLSGLPAGIDIAVIMQQVESSDNRLEDLSHAYEVVRAKEANGALSYSDILGLQNTANAITDFDKSGLSDEGMSAISKAHEIPTLLSRSDSRISQALGNATNAQLRNFKVSTALYNNIQSSVMALQRLDVDRLSSDERNVILTACNAQPALAPGMVAPEVNLNCSKF